MKTIIFTVALATLSFTLYAQEITPKKGIESLTTKEVQNKFLSFLEGSRVKKTIDFLDQDLVLSFTKNKVTAKSSSDFKFFKINGQQMPSNASIKLGFFDYEFMLSKEKGLISLVLTNP